jgi:DUF1016 N-terminal domain
MTKPKSFAVAVNEQSLYERISALLVTARQSVARGVDLIQVQTNFEIGRHIVEFEQQGSDRAAYGKTVVKSIANRLTTEFGTGFSETNLKLMKLFFSQYRDRLGSISQSLTDLSLVQKSQPMTDLLTNSSIVHSATGQLAMPSTVNRPFCVSWTHYVFLLGIKNLYFKPVEFDGFRRQAGLNSLTLMPKQWVEVTKVVAK